MERLQTTLLLIIKDNRILLARKKRGFGEGKINGIGGKMQPGETIDETMIRETIEEIGVVPKQYEKVGLITFDELLNGERVFNDMHIYVAGDFDGEIAESDEMCPEWYDLDKIPFDKMFGIRYFLPERNLKVKPCLVKTIKLYQVMLKKQMILNK